MQKKVIALAVAGLVSGAAFAQSNVTIYGVADVGAEYADANNGAGRQFRVQSGQSAGSRLGFKGEEALGNGLKAVFQLEMGIAMDNGTSTVHASNGGSATGTNVTTNGAGNATEIFQRQAFAGIESATLGAVTFGRQYTPMYAVKAKTDAFGLGMNGTFNNMMSYVPGNNDRWNNQMVYSSPVMAGFSGKVAYSSGEENNVAAVPGATSDKGGRAVGLQGQYENGPIYVGLAYHDKYSTGNVAAGQNDVASSKGWLLGGSYDFKVVKAFANYAQGKTNASTGTETAKGKMWNLGLKAPFGNHAVLAAFTKGQNTLAGVSESDSKLWSLGYEYSMSKRTVMYASYAKMFNAANASFGIGNAITQGLTTAAGKDPSSVMFGMRHSF